MSFLFVLELWSGVTLKIEVNRGWKMPFIILFIKTSTYKTLFEVIFPDWYVGYKTFRTIYHAF